MPTPSRDKPSSPHTARLSICCWAAELTICGATIGRKLRKVRWPTVSTPPRNTSPPAGQTVLHGDPVEHLGPDIVEGIRRIKQKDGPDLILWGSSTLTPVLLEHGLADEILLLVFPVLLGTGKRFFSDAAPPRELALVTTKAVSSGVIISTYRPTGPLRTGSFADPPA
jgi:riboflavin biosynthesis pyrimidine reductase